MFRDKIKILYKRRRTNKSRYSANILYLSRTELKHTNTKLFIILYTYNKHKSTLLKLTRKNIYLKRAYKILMEDKDSYEVVSNLRSTRFLKSMVDKTRVFKVIEFVKKKQMLS